jgi:hypothetical protein
MQLRLGASSTTKTPDCCNLSIQQMCSVALLGSAVVRLDGGINHALNLLFWNIVSTETANDYGTLSQNLRPLRIC